jgi:hypothetical protein
MLSTTSANSGELSRSLLHKVPYSVAVNAFKVPVLGETPAKRLSSPRTSASGTSERCLRGLR